MSGRASTSDATRRPFCEAINALDEFGKTRWNPNRRGAFRRWAEKLGLVAIEMNRRGIIVRKSPSTTRMGEEIFRIFDQFRETIVGQDEVAEADVAKLEANLSAFWEMTWLPEDVRWIGRINADRLDYAVKDFPLELAEDAGLAIDRDPPSRNVRKPRPGRRTPNLAAMQEFMSDQTRVRDLIAEGKSIRAIEKETGWSYRKARQIAKAFPEAHAVAHSVKDHPEWGKASRRSSGQAAKTRRDSAGDDES